MKNIKREVIVVGGFLCFRNVKDLIPLGPGRIPPFDLGHEHWVPPLELGLKDGLYTLSVSSKKRKGYTKATLVKEYDLGETQYDVSGFRRKYTLCEKGVKKHLGFTGERLTLWYKFSAKR